MSEKKKRSIIIGSLCGVLLLMVVGYAAFSSLLNINGTSSISSNWEVKITNIVSKNIVGTASNASDPTYDDLSATFKTNLVSPGDSIEYDVTVSNSGNVNAKLDKITLTDSKNSAIKFSTSGLTEGDSLNAGDSAVLTVKVEYDESVTSQPSNLSSTLTVKLDYSQNTDNSGGSGTVGSSSIDAYGTSIAVVTEGDGLYSDEYETGRYIYKGANPNNYIIFNDETWRIMSVESDGTIKIMRNESIGDMAFDSAGLRTTGYCSHSYAPKRGCNVWAKMDNFVNYGYNGSVDADAELNTYLNTTYYNSLTNESQNLIISHDFSIGSVTPNNSDLVSQIISENTYKWNGEVGLMTISEAIRANTNTSLCGNHSLIRSNYSICQSTNYIYTIVNFASCLWTISLDADDTYRVFYVTGSGFVSAYYANFADVSNGVAPVVYLTSDISLVGDGTSSNPYVIE